MSILQSHILKHAICSGAVQVIVVMNDDYDHDESDEIIKVPLSLSYNSCRVKYQSLVLAADRYRSDNDVLTILFNSETNS